MDDQDRRITVDPMTWWDYVARTARAERQREISERTGIDETNVSRWKRGAQSPKAEMVAQFARAYQRPVLEAFVAAGFLTADEAKQRPAAAPSLQAVPDEDLVEELLRRLRHGASVSRAEANPPARSKKKPSASAARGVKRTAPTPARAQRSPAE